MNQLVGITTYEQGDKLNIRWLPAAGAAVGPDYHPLQAVPSSKDISRTVVAYTLPAGAGGKTSRSSWATPKSHRRQARWPAAVPRQLAGRDAEPAWPDGVGLALSFNAQHKLGLTRTATPVATTSASASPKACRMRRTNNAQISGTFGTVGNINAKDYDITFDGTNYMVTRMPEARRSTGPATGTPPTATLDLDAGRACA